jgi:hypothetical protein
MLYDIQQRSLPYEGGPLPPLPGAEVSLNTICRESQGPSLPNGKRKRVGVVVHSRKRHTDTLGRLGGRKQRIAVGVVNAFRSRRPEAILYNLRR